MIGKMSNTIRSPPQKSHVIAMLSGAIMTFLAVTGSVPPQYAAPTEWIGVYCLAAGLSLLRSARLSIIAVSAAAAFGVLADPIFLGGQALAWVYANAILLAFGLAGTLTGSSLSRKLTA